MIFETVISALIAPVMMAIQSRDVAQILLGRDAGWKAQRRTDGSVPLPQIVARHREHVIQGLVLGVSTLAVSPALFLWMSPAIAGLVLAIFLSAATARPAAALKRHRLLQSPPEALPPPIEIRARAAQERLAAELGGGKDAFQRLLDQPALFEFHSSCLPASAANRPAFDPHFILGMARLEAAGDLNAAATQLSRDEKLAVLGQPNGLDRLHRFVPRLATAA
jgi:membrane glycosyltransferase